MKKNKVKHLITICLILAIAIFMIAGTYSRYSTSGQGNSQAQLARWAVAITTDNGNTDLTQEETQDITFVLDTNSNVVAGKIAPGSSATATVELDLTGTEVAVDFTATIDESQISSLASYDKMVLTTKLGDKTLTSGVPQLINLENDSAFTAANGKKIVTLKLAWANDNENNIDDTTMGTAGGTLTIPVRFEAKQHIVTDAIVSAETSLAEALTTINEGGTLSLEDDMDLTTYSAASYTPMAFPDNATFNLEGKEITSNNMGALYGGNDLTIENGKFTTTGSYGLGIGSWADEGVSNITVENVMTEGGINVFNAKNVVLKNVTSTAHKYYAVWGDSESSIVIENGTYTASSESPALVGMVKIYGGNDVNPNGSFEIRGGTFITNDKKFCLDEVKSGAQQYTLPVIYGGTFDCDVTKYCADGYVCTQNPETEMWVVTAAE